MRISLRQSTAATLLLFAIFSVSCASTQKTFQNLRLSMAKLEPKGIFDVKADSSCASQFGLGATSRIAGETFTCVTDPGSAPNATSSTAPSSTSRPQPLSELCGPKDLDVLGMPVLAKKIVGESEKCEMQRVCRADYRRIFIHALASGKSHLQETCIKCDDGEFDQKLTDEARTSPEIQGSAGCDGKQFCVVCRRPKD